jgi:hypothetical protein
MGTVWRGVLQVVDSIRKIIALNYGHLCLVAANGDFWGFGCETAELFYRIQPCYGDFLEISI